MADRRDQEDVVISPHRPPRLRRSAPHLVAALLTFTGGVAAFTGAVGPTADPTPPVQREVVALTDHATAGWTETVELPVDAEMVGFTWTSDDLGELSVQAQRRDGSWAEELHLHSDSGEAPQGPTADGATVGGTAGPAWLGHDLQRVTVTVEAGDLRDLQLHAIDTEPAAQPALGPTVASALPSMPSVISRAQWGANESWRNSQPGCTNNPQYADNVDYAVIHHTVSSNDYSAADTAALLRGIYDFHVHSNGWCDIAYNFLVDRHGQVFEGRYGGTHSAVVGGHTGGFNTRSTGIAMVGDYRTASVSSSTYDSLRRLLAFKLGHHGIDPKGTAPVYTVAHNSSRFAGGQWINVQTVTNHGDLSNTECPGGSLRNIISRLRNDVAADINRSTDQRIAGDWDDDGDDTVGFYDTGHWILRNANTNGGIDVRFEYGYGGTTAVQGDWDGDGRLGIGVYDRATGWWYFRNSVTPGPPDASIQYGYQGAIPVVGDWDGDGRDGFGVYDGGIWYLRQIPSAGAPEITVNYGWSGPRPVTGDWNGDGVDGIGVFSGGHWDLRETPSAGNPQRHIFHGDRAYDRPVPGDWDGAGGTGLGIVRGAIWYERNSAGPGSDWILSF
ncbi:MAG: peptidoglycan recognition protein [Acidimicrobiales bacterium]|nr:peptidoglycan recognition protein [Acidimicrobiales bacterium]